MLLNEDERKYVEYECIKLNTITAIACKELENTIERIKRIGG